MLSAQEIRQYLQRIEFSQDLNPGQATLKALHKAHMQHIPFENLDIRLGIPVSLSLSDLFEKVITRRRGGFCYELNYLFSALLSAAGFNIRLISANVFNGKEYGPQFDHLLLLAETPDGIYLADVGFGDCFQEALLISSTPILIAGTHYRVEQQGHYYTVLQKKGLQAERPLYRFTLQSHHIDDFRPMCRQQQTSSDSHFTQKTVCSLPVPAGRTTLSDGILIESSHGKRAITRIKSEAEYLALLQQHFQICLPQYCDIGLLLAKSTTL